MFLENENLKKMESYKFNRRIFLKHYFTQRQKAAAVSWKYSKISAEYIPPIRRPFISFACLSHFLMCQVNHFLLTLVRGGRNLQIRTRNGENTKHDFEEIRPAAQFLPPYSSQQFSPNIGQWSKHLNKMLTCTLLYNQWLLITSKQKYRTQQRTSWLCGMSWLLTQRGVWQ